jgi:DNA-binding GntR family transcriptional regulator
MPIPKNYETSVRLSAKEHAFNQIQQWIIDGTLLPGEKINDTELAEALGVSRTPIREALQILELEGFVKMYPGKATQVTEIERDSIHDLIPPLAALQVLAAQLACEKIEEDTIQKLEDMNERFTVALKSKNDYSALKIDEDFHQAIIDAADNPYIQQLVRPLQAHVRRHFYHNAIVLTENSIKDHEKIIQLFKEKDKEKLTAVMQDNWLRTLEMLAE